MILLDTHAWIWWVDGSPELSANALDAIVGATAVVVSAWSCWELATLTRRGRLRLAVPVGRWIADARASENLEIIPVDQRTATYAGELPDAFPGDPSDRTVYATAIVHGLPLVTRDRAIRAYDPARTVW